MVSRNISPASRRRASAMETCSAGDVTGFLDGEPPPQTQSEGGSSPPSRSGSILPHPPTRRAPGSRGGRRPRRGRGSVPMGLEEDIRPHARSHHGLPLWAAELPQQPDPLAKGQCHQTGGQNAVRPGTLIPSPHPSNETGFPGGPTLVEFRGSWRPQKINDGGGLALTYTARRGIGTLVIEQIAGQLKGELLFD
jgi:hypothetical protein